MNVPEIRFKGLDKTWNKKTLDELVQLNSGMDISTYVMGIYLYMELVDTC